MKYRDKLNIIGRGLVFVIDRGDYPEYYPSVGDILIFDNVAYVVRGVESRTDLMGWNKIIGDQAVVVRPYITDPMPTLIYNWDDLAKHANDSDTHTLEISTDYCNGFIYPKDKSKKIDYRNYYLSTHTFYSKNFMASIKSLNSCGFNFVLDNWG